MRRIIKMYDIHYDFDEGEIDFEIDKSQLEDALQNIIFNEAKVGGKDCEKLFSYFVNELLDIDEMAEWFEDELKDYFEEEALDELKECNRRDKDPLGYVGMSQSDFI